MKTKTKIDVNNLGVLTDTNGYLVNDTLNYASIKLGLRKGKIKEIVKKRNFFFKIADGVYYVDCNQMIDNFRLDDMLSENSSYVDMLFAMYYFLGEKRIEAFINDGLIGDGSINDELDYKYLSELNKMVSYSKNNKITTLTKHTALVELKDGAKFFGLEGNYKNYVSKLIDGLKKVDLSLISLNDIVNYKLSDKDILADLNIGDSSAISISFFTIRNYLLYILPEYLAPNMSFPNNMVNIIFGDTDDISLEFSDLVDDLAVQYMNNLPKATKIS